MDEGLRCCVDRPPTAARHAAALTAILLILVCGTSLALRLLALLASPEPLGTDGYYYVVQVSDLLRQGRLHVPDASWVLAYLGAVHHAVAQPVLAVKLGAAGLATACVPLAFWCGRALTQRLGPACGPGDPPRGTGTAWLLAFWAAASPTLTGLAADFPKNLGALPAGLLAAALLLRPSKGPAGWAATAAALALTAWAHRLGAALLLVGAGGLGLGWWLSRRPFARGSGRPWLPWTIGGGVLGLFALASWQLPGLLHPADLERVFGQFDLSLGLPPPWCWLALKPVDAARQVEWILPWPALAVALIWAIRRPAARPLALALGLPLLVCLFPFWRRDGLDLGYRLFLMAPFWAALVLAALHARLGGRLHIGRFSFAGLFALGLILVSLSRFGAGAHDLPPYQHYRRLIAAIPRPLPELLIAHQGINFLYDHETGREAMAWAPEPELDLTRVGRLVWGVRDGEWLACAPMPADAPPPARLSADYVYAREDQWQTLRACAERDGDRDLQERLVDWHNPTRIRPRSLMRTR